MLRVEPLLMTQAARLAGVRYCDYVRDGELLAQCQMRAAELASLDVLSACSDPVRELHDLGGELTWFDEDPPAPDPTRYLLSEKERLDELPWGQIGKRMADRLCGVRAMRRAATGKKVLGWVEGPISLGAVMRGLTPLMEDILDDPEFVEALFDRAVGQAIAFALAQIEAGADEIGMGDAPASLIGPVLYEEYVLPRERQIIDAVHGAGATFRLHICGNTSRLTALMDRSGADTIDLDYPVDFGRACAEMPATPHLLGNLDPVRTVQNGTPETIREALRACHRAAGERYIVGAGCEVPAATPLPNLLAFAQYAHEEPLS